MTTDRSASPSQTESPLPPTAGTTVREGEDEKMINKPLRKVAGLFGLVLISSVSYGHGLMVDPPARNAHCGLNEKPDQATSPACVEAFQNDSNGGYQFMSVLTHDIGRKGGTSNNVCGFDSETWGGGATPWDVATNWPTTTINSGTLDITWDISWGPHFDDTEEFVYYITKPGFQFDPNQPLSWSDFESEPFCELAYSDSSPNANPNVTPDKGNALFHTTCNVPARSGHHVIYGEWGRNHYTFERFHGCIDVAFGGGNGNPGDGDPDDGSDGDPDDGSDGNPDDGSDGDPDDGSDGNPDDGSDGNPDDGSDGGNGLAACEHVISNEWSTGFTGAVRVTNTSDSPINGWEVSWEYTDGAVITSSWNTSLAGTNPYTAASLGWNSTIQPGQTVEFGFQGNKNGGNIAVSDVTGNVCN